MEYCFLHVTLKYTVFTTTMSFGFRMLENEYGMRCVLQRPFHEFFYDNFEDDTNARLLVDMQALDFESRGKRDLLSVSVPERGDDII